MSIDGTAGAGITQTSSRRPAHPLHSSHANLDTVVRRGRTPAVRAGRGESLKNWGARGRCKTRRWTPIPKRSAPRRSTTLGVHASSGPAGPNTPRADVATGSPDDRPGPIAGPRGPAKSAATRAEPPEVRQPGRHANRRTGRDPRLPHRRASRRARGARRGRRTLQGASTQTPTCGRRLQSRVQRRSPGAPRPTQGRGVSKRSWLSGCVRHVVHAGGCGVPSRSPVTACVRHIPRRRPRHPAQCIQCATSRAWCT